MRSFRVLYREFLFRAADVDTISPDADFSKLLGQIAALLIWMSLGFTMSVPGFDGRPAPDQFAALAWSAEHSLIATTMAIIGLLVVLSWDNVFPDKRDVLVLGSVPLRARTLFASRSAALATTLAVAVVAFNAAPGSALVLASLPSDSNLLALIFSLTPWRILVAYWLTVMLAAAFVFGAVLTLQGTAALIMPRRIFLRISAVLQMACFCVFLSTYFMEPSLTRTLSTTRGLAYPSYWFTAVFEEFAGRGDGSTAPLVARGLSALALISFGTVVVYAGAWFRTLRRIVEEPDIVPGSRSGFFLPAAGDSVTTAVVHFAIRTLARSRQHRLTLAFYLGIAFAFAVMFLSTPLGRRTVQSQQTAQSFASLIAMCSWIIGARVLFAIPVERRANWIFRTTQVYAPGAYTRGIRLSLFLLSVVPASAIASVLFLVAWPPANALQHLLFLAAVGSILACLTLHEFGKVPFTCAWRPGKTMIHMAFLGVLGTLWGLGLLARHEIALLGTDKGWLAVTAMVGVAVVVAWATAKGEADVKFDDPQPPALINLGLHNDGVLL